MATVTLVHNPNAGVRPVSAHDLRRALARRGFTTQTLNTATKPDLDRALRGTDIIVAAGGDGTVAKALRATRGTGTRIGIVPTGTANNIAAVMGIPVDQAAAVAILRNGTGRLFDLGKVKMPGLRHTLVESLGIGALADTAANLSGHGSESVRREGKLAEARHHLADGLAVAQPIARLTINGEDLSGRALFIEVLNIPMTGPNLALARAASPGDGLFDAVYATPAQRGALIDWLRDGARPEAVPALPIMRSGCFEIAWSDAALRVDDEFPPVTAGALGVRVCAERALIVAPPESRTGARRRPLAFSKTMPAY